MNRIEITAIRGDGIGSEVINAALVVLESLAKKCELVVHINHALMGGIAIDECGEALPQETINMCKNSKAVLLGAVGGSKWDNQPPHNRPESALLRLRKELNLFANIRPALLLPALKEASPLKSEILAKGIDFVMVRELVSGIYFGEHSRFESNGEAAARDILEYSTAEIRQVARIAFILAQNRAKRLVCVDKANVLESSRLWREVVNEVAKDYPQVDLTFMLVDNAAMQICKNPSQFDVILTENMFGDILSDEASVIGGSLGILPSASLNETHFGLYEPIHGSAPDIAGQDIANPIGTILSLAMMLEMSFYLHAQATMVREAVSKVLNLGYRTADIMSQNGKQVGCKQMGELIAESL